MVMTSSDGPIANYMKLHDHAKEMVIVHNVTGLQCVVTLQKLTASFLV
jgi:hypothetical protein